MAPTELELTEIAADFAAAPQPAEARTEISLVPAPHLATVEVVLITRDSRLVLEDSLPAARAAAEEAGAQLLFVDLGSTDGTREVVAAQAPGARGIWLTAADGLAEAVNAAAACSSADILLIAEASLAPRASGAISGLAEHLKAYPCAAVAAPALPTLEPPAPTVDPDRAFDRVDAVPEAAFAIRRSDLIGAGGFEERFSGSLEARELWVRMRKRGREIHRLNRVELREGSIASRELRGSKPDLRTQAVFARRHLGYLLRSGAVRHTPNQLLRLLRRTFDVALAGLLLLVLAPVMIALALAIRLDSSGPAIFRQRRVGQGGRTFEMYKFRSMEHNADTDAHREHVRDMIVNRRRAAGSAPKVFKLYPDVRITRMGRLLRRTSLDELPQLLNVLRGDMTFVGFRPPIPYELEHYPAWYHHRFHGRPGLTGLWQVSGRNELSYEDMVSFDIEYANRRSWLLDLRLLVRTVGVVLTGRGAY